MSIPLNSNKVRLKFIVKNNHTLDLLNEAVWKITEDYEGKKMKKMRLFIGMLIATFLLGCVTADQQYKELSSKKEVIKSFFIADNRIYAIGQLNSYQFNSKDNGNTAQLIKLLESPYTKNISSVKIDEIRKKC